MYFTKPAAILLTAVTLCACTESADMIYGTRSDGGTPIAMGGALLGKDLAGAVGKSLDNSDRAAYDRISQRAMENGEANVWSNPDSGNHGTFVPRATYINKGGLCCRKYTQAIFIENIPHQGNGAACRRMDGWWQAVSG